MKILELSIALIIGLSGHQVVGNVWTTDCRVLATQRLDPIVFPGYSPAGHVHTIAGGSKFSHDQTFDNMMEGQCTTCDVVPDKSNYWVPQLYIRKQSDGKFHFVNNRFAVYYKLINDRGQTDTVNNVFQPGEFNSFPAGFKMLAGSPYATSPLDYINHKCLGMSTGADTPGFSPQPELCTGGMRSEVTFPSCWDGRLYSESPMDDPHVVHPIGGWAAGKCPDSHPKRLPTLFFEAIFQVQEVYQPGDQLVYSFNDTQGYGFHGDFFNGWEDGVVDRFIEYCRTNSDGFATQCGAIAEKHPVDCPWEDDFHHDQEQFRGILDELPPWDGPWIRY